MDNDERPAVEPPKPTKSDAEQMNADHAEYMRHAREVIEGRGLQVDPASPHFVHIPKAPEAKP